MCIYKYGIFISKFVCVYAVHLHKFLIHRDTIEKLFSTQRDKKLRTNVSYKSFNYDTALKLAWTTKETV